MIGREKRVLLRHYLGPTTEEGTLVILAGETADAKPGDLGLQCGSREPRSQTRIWPSLSVGPSPPATSILPSSVNATE